MRGWKRKGNEHELIRAMNKLKQNCGDVYKAKCKYKNITKSAKRSIVPGYGIACQFKCHQNIINAEIN